MEPTTITPEIVADDRKEMLAVVEAAGLAPEASQPLQASFAPFFAEARSVIEQSRGITVTDASQKLQIELARKCRLALRAIRVGADKTRKELKEESDRKSKAIQGFYNILLHLVAGEETRLDEQEKFIERQEAARKAALKATRERELGALGVDVTAFQLAEMSDAAYGQLLENTIAANAAKIEAARKAEEERIRLENERLKEQARIREDNERLRREAEEREAAAKAERQRKQAAQNNRAAMMLPYVESGDAVDSAFLGELTEEQFTSLYTEAKQRRVKRIADEAEKRRLEEQAAHERREAAEAARLAEEKRRREVADLEEKAKAEREAAAKKAKAAKDAADALAKKEREAREKVEAELKAQRDAETKRKAAEEKARRDAELAPEREKIESFAQMIVGLDVPVLDSLGGAIVTKALRVKLTDLAVWLRTEAKNL